MEPFKQEGMQSTYMPSVSISQITARHTMGRVLITTVDAPEQVCGVARRIGYTGRHDSDLAIYRLKVRENAKHNAITLPALFVVDGGLFVDYQQWQQEHGTASN